VIELITSNLGANLDIIVIFCTVIAGLIFMAVDVRFGIMMLFFLFGVEFVAFYNGGVSTTYVLYALLATFAVLALTILITRQRVGTSGGVQ
jgi:hypothetical protein